MPDRTCLLRRLAKLSPTEPRASVVWPTAPVVWPTDDELAVKRLPRWPTDDELAAGWPTDDELAGLSECNNHSGISNKLAPGGPGLRFGATGLAWEEDSDGEAVVTTGLGGGLGWRSRGDNREALSNFGRGWGVTLLLPGMSAVACKAPGLPPTGGALVELCSVLSETQ